MNKFAIIASRFNQLVVENLVEASQQTLIQNQILESQIDIFWVPGALEIPIVAQKAAKSRQYAALIALGCVIQGDTDHYDHVAREVYQGLMRVSLDTNTPITVKVLTTKNLEQALERAGGPYGNAGHYAASAALDLVKTLRGLES